MGDHLMAEFWTKLFLFCISCPKGEIKIVTRWTPDEGQRRRGRPRRRCRDDQIMFAGLIWPEIVQSRESKEREGEAFAQEWETR